MGQWELWRLRIVAIISNPYPFAETRVPLGRARHN
jgi:hypothetical protein